MRYVLAIRHDDGLTAATERFATLWHAARAAAGDDPDAIRTLGGHEIDVSADVAERMALPAGFENDIVTQAVQLENGDEPFATVLHQTEPIPPTAKQSKPHTTRASRARKTKAQEG